MGDEIHRVIAGHILILKEIGGVAFAFCKDRHQDIGTGHFGAAGALDVNGSALDDLLEGRCRHRFGAINIGHQIGEIFVDKFNQ